MIKEIILLGSTGSIGTQTLSVVRKYPDRFKIVAMACHSNVKVFNEQINEFKPKYVYIADSNIRANFKSENVQVLNSLEELVSIEIGHIVVTALVGVSGLLPTIKAIENKKDIALANKETLVAGGDLVMSLAKKNGVNIFPVDSEHSAIWQCLSFYSAKDVSKLILTASGGAFRGKTLSDLKTVTLSDALKHPTWNMGKKVTIDSASLMNKGLEVIEAKHLFEIDTKNIDVVVHKESIIHSMVAFKDSSIIAQMSKPSMVLPIQLALTYPNRLESDVENLDFSKLSSLSFEMPDLKTFRCLALAYECARIGGLAPAILNASNEIAVEAFICNKIAFLDIPYYIEETLSKIEAKNYNSVEEIFEIDQMTRKSILNLINKGDI